MDSDRRLFTTKSIVFVVLCGVLAYLAFAFLPFLAGPGPTMTGVAVQPTTQAPAPSTPTASTDTGAPVPAGPAASPPQRLVYPAADIDVVVHPLEPTGEDQATQTIVPPPTMDGYWLSPYGAPGAGSVNTTYIAGHSWTDRDAPFNRLSTKAAAGDRLTVATATGEVAYLVDSVTTYVKSGLKDSPIWQVAPNRLVLISCYTGDAWGTNVVVVASPEDPTLSLSK
ncbi:class F sortase [Arthrobacter sp. Soil762]|uniref:class F sortase n=1 Tax=Arthrobacter sp. Soil762 TaxID=1736401 RepID=UPI0006F5E369|nr:class F sortase [Arthrobacter sp. Soil762]KRE69007.1 sortase [Arthrobacter sp. Soil762]